jgi:serine/threonine-protein kinase
VVEGDPVAVVPSVDEFDVSRDGTLVHLAPAVARLVWKSRRGTEHPLAATKSGIFSFVGLSPDGQRAVVTLHNAGRVQLWLTDQLDGEAVLTRLTPGNTDWFGLFTPDGRRLLFTSAGADDQLNIYAKAMDRNAPPERQTNSPNPQRATSVSRDGRFLFNNANVANASTDVWEQKLDQPASARPLLDSPAKEEEAAFSPDGRWIAYESDISGASEVYVQQYPNGTPHVVSLDGGGRPVWSRTGEEIFYHRSTSVFAVRVVNGARVGSPAKLFDRPAGRDRNWDTAPDNSRFLVADTLRPGYIEVVTNWFEELKAKVPAGGAK